MYNFILLDDHSIVYAGVKLNLNEFYSDFKLDYVKTADDLFYQLGLKKYDLLILDVNIPSVNIRQLLQQIFNKIPDLKILIFSMNPEAIFAKPLLKLGVKGYLSKDDSETSLLKAIEQILSGQIYTSDALKKSFADDFLEGNKAGNGFDVLSERELSICKMLLQGTGVAEISNAIHLHPSTVGTYKTRIYTKLKIDNLIQLKELAILHNIY